MSLASRGRRTLLSRVAVIAAGVPVLCACGADERAGHATRDAGAPMDADAAPAPRGVWDQPLPSTLEWEPCPLYTSPGEGWLNQDVECATLELPLVRGDESVGTQPYFVKRIPATQPRRGQVWLLQGGPGGSGVALEPLGRRTAFHAPDLDVYIPDHRGTGRSGRVDCPAVAAGAFNAGRQQLLDCAEAAGALPEGGAGLTVTEAAHDVAQLIAATAEPDDAVFVYGASYGGYWLHRLLQVAPTLLSGAVFDSTTDVLGHDDISVVERKADVALTHLLARCSEDAVCAARLCGDLAARIKEQIDTIDTCVPSMDTERFKRVLFSWFDSPTVRDLIPATFFRLAACDATSSAWLDAMVARGPAQDGGGGGVDDTSDLVNFHINLSELLGEPIPHDEDARVRDSLLGSEDSVRMRSGTLNIWPVYTHDDYYRRWAVAQTPLLVLTSELDQRTPPEYGEAVVRHFDVPDDHWVRARASRHGVVMGTQRIDGLPDDSPWHERIDCAHAVMVEFLADPDATLDQSCMGDEHQPDFAGVPEYVQSIWGSADAWLEPGQAEPAACAP